MKEPLPTTQSTEAEINTVFRAFSTGALLGFMLGASIATAIWLAHMAHHDRMFHTPKQEVRAN